MKVVLQRVKRASVTIDHKVNGQIEEGLLLLVGFTNEDHLEIVAKLAKKCCELRIFEDENQKMNKSIQDIKGSILSISQFTLYADSKKGRRPSFIQAARPEQAIPLYEAFNSALVSHGIAVETGIFGADMQVELLNDGPVTIILDSEEL